MKKVTKKETGEEFIQMTEDEIHSVILWTMYNTIRCEVDESNEFNVSMFFFDEIEKELAEKNGMFKGEITYDFKKKNINIGTKKMLEEKRKRYKFALKLKNDLLSIQE